MQDKIAAAVALAAECHAGQVDKGGTPYILHPLHVLSVVAATDHAKDHPYERDALLCAAVLHDVVEDTPYDKHALESRIYREFGARCSQALDALTRRKDERYMEDYVERIKRDWIARVIKMADLRHNLDSSRIPDVPVADRRRAVSRYLRALSALEEAELLASL